MNGRHGARGIRASPRLDKHGLKFPSQITRGRWSQQSSRETLTDAVVNLDRHFEQMKTAARERLGSLFNADD